MTSAALKLEVAGDFMEAFTAFLERGGFSEITTESQYDKVIAIMDDLADNMDGQNHSTCAMALDYLGTLVEKYEDEYYQIPDASPSGVLQFLMDQHDLKQSDLEPCMTQSRVSDVLRGEREISKDQAKCLAARFNVPADVFL